MRRIAAAVLALVCLLITLLILVRQPPELTLTLQGFERNRQDVLMALILVSNTGPHNLAVGTTGTFAYYTSGDIKLLPSHMTGTWTVPVPTFGRCQATIMCHRTSSGAFFDQVRNFINTRLLRRRGRPDYDTYTVQVRE